jgi:hypothetical protein
MGIRGSGKNETPEPMETPTENPTVDKTANEEIAAQAVNPSTEVAIAESFRSTKLMSVMQNNAKTLTTLDDVASSFGNALIEWDVISPSYDVALKDVFEGVPFVILAWRFTESKKYQTRAAEGNLIPAWFVSILVAPYDDGGNLGNKVIINDGSTGIYKQLEQVSDQFGVFGGVKCAKGLRKSVYDYEAPDGTVSEATTWYLA